MQWGSLVGDNRISVVRSSEGEFPSGCRALGQPNQARRRQTVSAVTSNYDSCCAGHAEACCASVLCEHAGLVVQVPLRRRDTAISDLGVFTGSSLAMLLERYGANCCTERLSDHVIAATGRIFGCRQGSTLPMSPRDRYLKPLQRLGGDTGPVMPLSAGALPCLPCPMLPLSRAAYLP